MRQHPKDKDEAGAALVEAVLTIPILLVFALAMFDLGNWFLQHYALSRVVYEGSRVGAGLADLKVADSTVWDDTRSTDPMPCIKEDLNSAMPASLSYNEKGHYVMKTRMAVIAQRQFEDVDHDLLAFAEAWSCFDDTNRLVEAEVRMPFQSVFLGVININGWLYSADMWPDVRARARAPYLYAN